MWEQQIAGPQLELEDIQGDIVVGLQKDFEWFVFFKITDAAKFKDFARRKLLPEIASAADLLDRDRQIREHKDAGNEDKLPLKGVNIGFTRSGLEKLNVADFHKLKDEAFLAGLSARAELLNYPKDGNYSPGNWKIGRSGNEPDGVILITGPTQAIVDEFKNELTGLASVSGWEVDEKQCERGMTRPERSREHFGFVDGISQPGFRDDRLPAAAGRLWPGEFVFGYPTENPKDPGFPGQPAGASGPEWIKNGSLMVVQRFIQRVPEFNAFINKTADDDLAMDRELLAARVVGRWRSGAPLSIAPLQDNPLLGADEERNNNFDFANDPASSRCPFAAHIRKVYPRDDITVEGLRSIPAERLGAASEFEKRQQSANFTAKHRIIRRGIPFGPELTAEENKRRATTHDRGLMFVSYQTSIVDQFEYIVTNLVNQPDFAPHQGKTGLDALLGKTKDGKKSIKGLSVNFPTGKPAGTTEVDTFVYPTGGGYFFVPSISTFEKFVAQTKEEPKMPGQTEVVPTFNAAVDLFNHADYEGLRPLLHTRITWKMLHHADSVRTVDAVIDWLKVNKADLRPMFTPLALSAAVPRTFSDGSQQIDGLAWWKARDDQNDQVDEEIQYSFTFLRESGEWKLSDVHGHVTGRRRRDLP